MYDVNSRKRSVEQLKMEKLYQYLHFDRFYFIMKKEKD